MTTAPGAASSGFVRASRASRRRSASATSAGSAAPAPAPGVRSVPPHRPRGTASRDASGEDDGRDVSTLHHRPVHRATAAAPASARGHPDGGRRPRPRLDRVGQRVLGVTLDLEFGRVLPPTVNRNPRAGRRARFRPRVDLARSSAAASGPIHQPRVDVGDAQCPRQATGERGLAAPGGAVDRDHARCRSYRPPARPRAAPWSPRTPGSSRRRPRYRRSATGSRPPARRPPSPSPSDGRPRRGRPPSRPPPRSPGRPLRPRRRRPDARMPLAIACSRSLSFTRSSAASRNQESDARVRGERGEDGHLVDDQGELPRLDARPPDPVTRLDRDRPDRLTELRPLDAARRADAHPLHDLEEVERLGLRPTPSIVSADPVSAAAAIRNAADEGSPGTGPRETLVLETAHRGSPSRRSIGAPERRERPLGVVAGRRRLGDRWSSPSAASPASRTALLTCALGTASRWRMPCSAPPSTRPARGRRSVSIEAPIVRSGSATRSIGRTDRLSSPVRTDSNGAAASTPREQPHRGPGVPAVEVVGRARPARRGLHPQPQAGLHEDLNPAFHVEPPPSTRGGSVPSEDVEGRSSLAGRPSRGRPRSSERRETAEGRRDGSSLGRSRRGSATGVRSTCPLEPRCPLEACRRA